MNFSTTLTAAAALLLAVLAGPAIAATPVPSKMDALCQPMLDKAASTWPAKQIDQCAPWRKQRQTQVESALQQCKTAHATDENLDACAIQEEASSRFWERNEQLEAQLPNHVVHQLPNPMLPPAEKPLEDAGAGTHVAQ